MVSAKAEYESMQRCGVMTRSQMRELSIARQKYMKLRRRVLSIPTRLHYEQLRAFLRRENVPLWTLTATLKKYVPRW